LFILGFLLQGTGNPKLWWFGWKFTSLMKSVLIWCFEGHMALT
jgi:hypothetical protein